MRFNDALMVLVLAGILLGLLLCANGSIITGPYNIYSSLLNRYNITGTVHGEIGHKISMASEGSGTTKYSVSLDTEDGRRIVNCTSTQCASLVQDDLATLSCYKEWHLFTPDEHECRFVEVR